MCVSVRLVSVDFFGSLLPWCVLFVFQPGNHMKKYHFSLKATGWSKNFGAPQADRNKNIKKTAVLNF